MYSSGVKKTMKRYVFEQISAALRLSRVEADLEGAQLAVTTKRSVK